MPDFLILKLQGVMQAWGGHTFEDYRPVHPFPTRSGITGLLGACLGIDRQDKAGIADLSASFVYAVRSDTLPVKFTDFHTVMDARKVDGKENKNPVVSRREYLCDAKYTLALQLRDQAVYTAEEMSAALKKPCYTPFLGRRSCPLCHPLFETIINAENLLHALSQIAPYQGTVYSEQDEGNSSRMMIRDVPMPVGKRQFATRTVCIIPTGGGHVSE